MHPKLLRHSYDDEDIRQRLVAAINTQSVATVAADLLALPPDAIPDPSRALARQALAATDAISRRMREVRDTLAGKLRQAGIDAAGIAGPEDSGSLQFHACTIAVPGRSLDRALGILGGDGFLPPIALDRGRLKVLQRAARTISLVQHDDASTRVVLSIADAKPAFLPSRLRPAMTDLGAVHLPSGLWPLYFLVRPIRVAVDRISRRRRPNAESDYLSTPVSVIAPLLDHLSLTASDNLVDLGCGDGRIVTEAALRYGCRTRGIESNPAIVALARRRLDAAGLAPPQATIEAGAIEAADLSGATVIFMFLPSYLLARFLPAIRRKVGREVRIVTHEQTRSATDRPPDRSIPIFGADGVTVAHFWQGGG